MTLVKQQSIKSQQNKLEKRLSNSAEPIDPIGVLRADSKQPKRCGTTKPNTDSKNEAIQVLD